MSRSYSIILGPVTGEIGSLRAKRRALVPHKSTSARTVPHLTSQASRSTPALPRQAGPVAPD